MSFSLVPKLSRTLAEAVLDDLVSIGFICEGDARLQILDRWSRIIQDKFVPVAAIQGTPEERVQKFFERYPEVQDKIDRAKTLILAQTPNATFHLEIHQDYEVCGICEDPYGLTLYVLGSDEHTIQAAWSKLGPFDMRLVISQDANEAFRE